MTEAKRDDLWLIRTYAGHSNDGDVERALPGKPRTRPTGLSVAYDLPTRPNTTSLH